VKATVVKWPPTARLAATAVRLVPIIALAAMAAGSAEAKRPVDELTEGILTHVRESAPPTWRSADTEAERVRYFALLVREVSLDPIDVPKLLAAANAAIDAANGPTATPDSLVRAAIAGAAASLRNIGKAPCEGCQNAEPRPRSAPTSVQVGTIGVVSLPDLRISEMAQPTDCSALDHYFDFPAESVSGLVLDLRGNQGGYLRSAICLARELLEPSTALFRIVTRRGVETVEAPSADKPTPITLPVVVFVDKDTESGGLLLAALLQDTGRATLIGESKEEANGAVSNVFWTPNRQDVFQLPIGYFQRLGGTKLAAGVQVDVAVSPASDDEALMQEARARLAGAPR
jgi:Peptidase family S41